MGMVGLTSALYHKMRGYLWLRNAARRLNNSIDLVKICVPQPMCVNILIYMTEKSGSIGACSGADDVAELESPSRLSNYHNCGSGIWLGAQGRCS